MRTINGRRAAIKAIEPHKAEPKNIQKKSTTVAVKTFAKPHVHNTAYT